MCCEPSCWHECICVLAAPPSLCVPQLMEFHKPFVSASVIDGQLLSPWFTLSAMLGARSAVPRALSKHPTHRSLGSSLTLSPWVIQVTMMSLPSRCFCPTLHSTSFCGSCLLSPPHYKEDTILHEVLISKVRWVRGGGPQSSMFFRSPHMNSSLPNPPSIPKTFNLTSSEGPKPLPLAFLLLLIKHEHLLMTNKNQRCCDFAVRPRKRWNRCTGSIPQQFLVMIR